MSAEVHEIPDRRPRLRAVTLAELIALELPPRDVLLNPWLLGQGLGMVYAPRGIGKTHFGFGVAYAVAAGGRFLGWAASGPRRVLYLDGEMPAIALQERLAALVDAADQEPPADEFFTILTPDLQERGMPDLATPEGQEAVEPFVQAADLILVDNLSTLCRAGKENEGEGWLPVQDWALGLRAAGKSLLFIHHAGKGGTQRGTSRREDVLDVVIALRRPDDYTPEQGARFEVHFEKARHLFGDDATPFEAALGEDERGRPVWTTRTLEDCLTQRVAALLAEGMKQRAIARELEVGLGTVNRHAKKARELGLVVIEGGRGDDDAG